jgi:hypothetical protein
LKRQTQSTYTSNKVVLHSPRALLIFVHSDISTILPNSSFNDFSSHSRLLLHNPRPLLQHMSEQHPNPRYIHPQNRPHRIPPILPLHAERIPHNRARPPHQPTLTTHAHRIQHQESVIPQPRPQSRYANVAKRENKVTITYNLRNAPRKQHSRIRRRRTRSFRERIGNEMHEEEAGGDLHEGC